LILLDEFNTGLPAVQNAMLQFVRERRLGQHKLGDGWAICAAGNRAKDKAHLQKLAGPMINRFTFIDVDLDPNDTSKIAAQRNWAPEVQAFMRWRPDLIHAELWASSESKRVGKPIEPDYTQSFESPRAWENASKIVQLNLPDAIEHELLCGTIGNRAAVEFAGFKRTFRNMRVNPDSAIMNPKTAPVPAESDIKFALTTAIARKATDSNFDRVIEYAERLGADFAVACVVQATGRDPELCNTHAFTRFASLNPDVLY
jgi:hypothetical protein